MLDILAYLIEQFFSPADCPEPETLSRHLAAAGFDSHDIDDAMDWLRQLGELDAAAYAPLQGLAGLPRVLHPREADRLSPEAQSFFYYLSSTDALSFGQRELLLDRLMLSSAPRVDVQTVKQVALMVLWHQGNDLANLLIEELLHADAETRMH